MRRSTILRAAILPAAVAVPRGPAAAQTASISVGVAASQDVVASIYAQSAGLFTKAGLNVQLVTLVNGAAISAAVAGGSLQIGFSSLQGLISGHVHGVPFQLIAPGGIYTPDDPYAYLFVRKDAPIQSARDLNGKTLGSPALKDLDWIANAAWMEKNGGDIRTCKTVEFPASALLAACVEGRLDAYTVGEPYSTLALDSGKVRVLGKSFSAIAEHFLMTGWFATADYVAKNRDVVERFNRAIADATTYANAHKAEMIPLLAPFLKVDPQVVARTMKGGEGVYLDAALIQPMIDATAHYGIIDRAFAAADLISPAALKRPRPA
jgi:NitT/TauT family transport system substrate-binding protein